MPRFLHASATDWETVAPDRGQARSSRPLSIPSMYLSIETKGKGGEQHGKVMERGRSEWRNGGDLREEEVSPDYPLETFLHGVVG